LTDSDLNTYEGFRKVWRDNFDYQITATNPAQGRYSVRIFEINSGASNQNVITGTKAIKINGYLTRWGCTSIVISNNEINFNIALWDAVRSIEFWDVTAEELSQVSFILNSYSGQTGIADITVTHPEPYQYVVAKKIVERFGTVLSSDTTFTRFTLERSQLFEAFKKDVKQKAETVYMYQRFRFNIETMEAAVTAGGILELTKSQLLSAIRDMQAE
jgi:hypothetical protein